MTNAMDTKPNNSNKSVYKKSEFKAFLKIVEDRQVAHWVEIAEALGVSQETIVAWKKLPEAQEAIARGIQNALDGMETSGKRDWRMYFEKYKMLLGRSEVPVQINFAMQILNKYQGTSGEGISDIPRFTEIEGGSPKSPS